MQNPFDIAPPCEEYVPGWGDRTGDFHLILDRPRVERKNENNPLPEPSNRRLGRILADVGLFDGTMPSNLFVSYRYPCSEAEEPDVTHRMESVFDAELRAVTAHVLVPVGEKTIEAVLRSYSPVVPEAHDLRSLHAREIATGSWILLPILDPARWSNSERVAVREAFEALLERDYRREADLGRHVTGPESYLVR